MSNGLPTVEVTADYGAIGLTPSRARSTFTVTGAVSVPLFTGGRREGRTLEADTDLRARRAEAEDLRADVYYDVRTAFLDLQAIGEELQVATRGRELANQQLTQSRDRFAAGVASNIEVVQAQEAVAVASEQYISALYGYSVAKGVLAQSLGTAEEAVGQVSRRRKLTKTRIQIVIAVVALRFSAPAPGCGPPQVVKRPTMRRWMRT